MERVPLVMILSMSIDPLKLSNVSLLFLITGVPHEATAMGQLMDMGFANRQKNDALLVKHNYDVEKVVQDLLSMGDNDWAVNRH